MDIGRSAVFEAFLRATDADYLLCVDSDMVFTVEDYDRLKQGLENNPSCVVSGVYMQVNGEPCVFQETPEGALANVDPTQLMAQRYYEAASAGLGFTLVRRETFEAIRESMPDDYPLPFSDNTARGSAGQPLADDSSFFYRARQAGYPLYVDTKTKIGHLKTVTMYPRLESKLEIAREVPK